MRSGRTEHRVGPIFLIISSGCTTRPNGRARPDSQRCCTTWTVEALERAFQRLRRKAAPGVDGMTVETYEGRLVDNLRELCDRVHSGRYKPRPVRRTYIPKADGGKRPLGILVLEDKIVQGAVAEVLSAIYEADFLDCSYGFRPGRSAHQALRTIHDAVISERVNWVFEADIRKCYDSIDHEWLMRMVEHRIADPRILRLIRQWLEVGVLENGVYAETVEGTPQGAGISPLLANIFLHYALDLWVLQWMRRTATGPMRLVRYADDFLLTFERRADADRMATALAERLAKFGLRLHEDKTRLIESDGSLRRTVGDGAKGGQRPSISWALRTIAERPWTGGSWSTAKPSADAWSAS